MVDNSADLSRSSERSAHLPAIRFSNWSEAWFAVIIGISALGTSWTTYQAALWNGAQAIHFSLAGAHRTGASRKAIEANTVRAVEIGLFSAWADSVGSNNQQLAQFYESRFTPTLKAAFKEWIQQDPFTNPNAAASPFALKSYLLPGVKESEALEVRANEEFQSGVIANGDSDAYTRTAVIFATSMFFAGIGQVFHNRRIRNALMGIAAVSCAIAFALLVRLPIMVPS